jgi:5'-3' exonuclease
VVAAPAAQAQVRKVACVADKDIERFRSQIRVQEDQGICEGDTVAITSGPYKNLKALVVEDVPELEVVQVHVQLRSKDSLVTLPRAFLRLHEKAAKQPFAAQRQALRSWVAAAVTLAQWAPACDLGPAFAEWLRLQRIVTLAQVLVTASSDLDLDPLRQKALEFERFQDWFSRAQSGRSAVVLLDANLNERLLREAWAHYERLSSWAERANFLSRLVFSLYDARSTHSLQTTFIEWAWLDDAHERLTAILAQVERIEQQMAAGGVQNLVIDGHNLAIRCATTPGLGELKDAQGRPTGAIVGFLNTLTSLKKRYPGVEIYVTWDGSSDRRRAMFSGYKEGRGNPRAVFEVQWLQQNLPRFGVTQAWHSKEEADDVIATLVRGRLAGQSNVIFTTDRDLLQLVTTSTCVLVPAVGSGKERFFGPAEVEAEYGVPPAALPQLRALAGDTSDTIPGCPNCGLKTAAKLVKLYGTVEKLLSSNLAGLSKGLVVNLRAAEAQVRLNVRLMTLVTDLSLVVTPPDVDAKAAVEQLQEVEVKPDRYLPVFFGEPAAV